MQVGMNGIAPPLEQLTGDGLTAANRDVQDGKHLEAARKFETLIATQLVKELRRGLPDGFFGDGPGSDVYNGWLDTRLGESLAENWQLDLAGMVKTNLDSKQARLEGALEQLKEGTR